MKRLSAQDDANTATTNANITSGLIAGGTIIDIGSPTGKIMRAQRTAVFDSVQYFLTLLSGSSAAGWTDITAEAGTTRGTTSGDILGVIGDYFYVGKVDQFSTIYFDIVTAKSATGVLSFEYSTTGSTWTTLSVTDGTVGLTVDGAITFTPPGDWVTGTVNSVASLYWVRIGVASGTFSVEPTVALVVPSNTPILEIFANGNDTVPSLTVDAQGGVAIGYADSSIYGLRVLGPGLVNGALGINGALTGATTGAFSSTVTHTVSTTGFTHVGGTILNGPAATALIPAQNSPVTRYSSQAWDGALTRINAMDVYVSPDADPYLTKGRLTFKNTTLDGSADATELMNLSANGRLNVLGRIESQYDVFDSVMSFVTSVFTDLTLSVSAVGIVTGDVLNVVGDWVYIGKHEIFESAFFRFDTIMSSGTTRDWEYWNGSAWTNFTPTSDGTTNWSTDGLMEFTAPGDWATTTVNNVSGLYWIRVGTVSGTFGVEPTLRVLTPNSAMNDARILSNGDFDTSTGWAVTGDWAYTTLDYTFTYSTGAGTLTQVAANFVNPAKPNTWYRFRCINGVAAPANTVSWIGEEFADGKVYFSGSTTEVDAYFKTNDNPGDFVIYTTATGTSGYRLDLVSLMEVVGGDILATGEVNALSVVVEDEAYSAGWNGSLEVPTKNALYDKIETMGSGAVESVNGQTGAVVLDQDDIADGTTAKQYTATEKTKLSGVATGATANDTDANLKNRANHTGTQAISTVTDLQTSLDAKAALASTGATVVHGSTASTARPSGYTAVTWIGSVEPTNATNDDVWVSTAAAPSTAANPYSFAARKSGSTQALSASTFTKVTLETVESDDNGDFSNSRYTATVAGKYTFTWRVGLSTATRLFSTLYKNGSEVWRGTDADTSRASAGAVDSIALAVNDYVELYAWASTSVTMVSGVGNTAYLSGHLISETV
jgi:hypothetical protein